MHPWLRLEQEPAAVVVTPVGDLDAVGAGSLRSALAEAANWGLPVVVDLTGVAVVEPAALAVLVGGRNRLLARGGSLTLIQPTAQLWQAIHTTGLDRVLTISPRS